MVETPRVLVGSFTALVAAAAAVAVAPTQRSPPYQA